MLYSRSWLDVQPSTFFIQFVLKRDDRSEMAKAHRSYLRGILFWYKEPYNTTSDVINRAIEEELFAMRLHCQMNKFNSDDVSLHRIFFTRFKRNLWWSLKKKQVVDNARKRREEEVNKFLHG